MVSAAFRRRIRRAIANPVLQAALDANAQRRVDARTRALASLPDYEERRQRAAALRADTIARLDEHLARFIANAEANGIKVHRARDAAQAREIVLRIINQPQRARRDTKGELVALREAKQVAKSKSMVSEEIGLNEALEAADHRVVETDLGEYIVQLRGEKPSHIITPAVHLRRQEVAQLFHEKLGISYTEDVETLTAAARRELRQVFLNADVGVSGVNFGVVESGTLCIVTNEGNGRMVTTLPRVHVALMGMERIVPTMDDLALMLSLLPRSATGQKISVYTQFIQQPLPGQERHLVILDNRRSALRASTLNESLHCIRCGACLNACPVFREIGGHAYNSVYPGPIGSVISAGLFGPEHSELAYACSLCGACAEVCPVKIPLPDLLVRVRAGASPPGGEEESKALPRGLAWGLRLYRLAATRPRLYRAAQRMLSRLAPRDGYISAPAWTGWGLSKDFPAPARETFGEWWEEAGNKVSGNRVTGQPVAPSPGHPITPPPAPLTAQFTTELTALGGAVIPCAEESLAEEILRLLRGRDIETVMAWEQTHLPLNLLDSLREEGLRVAQARQPDVQAGITGALAAVADLGALLIPGGEGCPLSVSLLPPLHIAILHSKDILPNLESALRLPAVTQAPASVLIAGPSRTADIEMTLSIGVHGPGEVVIFLVDGDTPRSRPAQKA